MLQGIRWELSCLYGRGHVTCVSRGEEKQLLPDILNCSGEAKDQTRINMQTQVSAVLFFFFEIAATSLKRLSFDYFYFCKTWLHAVKNTPVKHTISDVFQEETRHHLELFINYFVHVNLFSTLFLCSVTISQCEHNRQLLMTFPI